MSVQQLPDEEYGALSAFLVAVLVDFQPVTVDTTLATIAGAVSRHYDARYNVPAGTYAEVRPVDIGRARRRAGQVSLLQATRLLRKLANQIDSAHLTAIEAACLFDVVGAVVGAIPKDDTAGDRLRRLDGARRALELQTRGPNAIRFYLGAFHACAGDITNHRADTAMANTW